MLTEYWMALVLGLVGSAHCAGMCGPLVLVLPSNQTGRARFLTGRIAYNGGRLVTYAAMGLLFGLAGKTLWLMGVQRWVSIGLGLVLLLGMFTSRKLAVWRPVTALVDKLKKSMTRLLRLPSATSLFVLGLLNGLLPCGLVYVAAAGAVATGGILAGSIYMAAFGVGTFPMMLAISLSSRLLPFSLRLQLRKVVPVSVFVLAALLILRGMGLGIPYVSPNLGATGVTCCHH